MEQWFASAISTRSNRSQFRQRISTDCHSERSEAESKNLLNLCQERRSFCQTKSEMSRQAQHDKKGMAKRFQSATNEFVRSRFVFFRVVVIAWAIGRLAHAAEPESADLRYFRELVETRNYSLGQPVSPQLTPDGKAVIFLRGGPRDPVLRLYELTIANATLREILT